jgi:putative nucleotidyltransferase with HDIG domain
MLLCFAKTTTNFDEEVDMTEKDRVYNHDKLEGLAGGLRSGLERKHPYTKGHCDRVSAYAVRLALTFEPTWSATDIAYLRIGGLLHDIGKICVEESTLNYTGEKLSIEQVRELEDHPMDGWEIVRKSGVDVPDIIRDAILAHHESYDGVHTGDLRGYPLGLHGEAIPLVGRIVAVADTFDALTSKRTYQAVVSFEEAAKKLRDLAGTKLDPKLVELFVEKVIPTLLA